MRGFAADLADKHHIEVTATYDEHRDQWELRWNALHTAPDRDQVRAALCADADLAPHSRAITLRPVEDSTG